MFKFRLRQYSSIGSVNGVAPKRRQAIIWTNDVLGCWHIYAPLGLNELSSFNIFANKPLIGLSTNLSSELMKGLPGLINFWSHSTEFLPFPGIWLVEQSLLTCRQTDDWIELKFGGWTHYETPQAWLNFDMAALNSHCFLASYWLSSFWTFADKPLITLSSNLVCEITMGLPKSDWLFVMLSWIPQPFLTSYCSSSFCAYVDKPLIGLTEMFVLKRTWDIKCYMDWL